jgi:hypothetical protein
MCMNTETVEPVPSNCPLAPTNVPEPSLAKRWAMSLAESIDALRLVPRLIIIGYGFLVGVLVIWFMGIDTAVQMNCDAGLIKILLDAGQDLEVAKDLACSVANMVGGPTTAQTTFVTTIIGLATPLFAFYATTGKKWGEKKDKA